MLFNVFACLQLWFNATHLIFSADWKHTRDFTQARHSTVNQRDAQSTLPHLATWGSTFAHTPGRSHSGEHFPLVEDKGAVILIDTRRYLCLSSESVWMFACLHKWWLGHSFPQLLFCIPQWHECLFVYFKHFFSCLCRQMWPRWLRQSVRCKSPPKNACTDPHRYSSRVGFTSPRFWGASCDPVCFGLIGEVTVCCALGSGSTVQEFLFTSNKTVFTAAKMFEQQMSFLWPQGFFACS